MSGSAAARRWPTGRLLAFDEPELLRARAQLGGTASMERRA